MASRSHRRLFDLPQRQMDRVERRLNYEKHQMKTAAGSGGESVGGVAANAAAAGIGGGIDGVVDLANAAIRMRQVGGGGGQPSQLQQPKTQQEQHQLQHQQHQQQQQVVIVTHSHAEVASLPLLRPFGIRKPVESVIVNSIINEQHAADTLEAAMRREERLRNELLKARSENSKDNGGNGNGGTNGNNDEAENKNGNSNNNKKSSKKSFSKNKHQSSSSSAGGGTSSAKAKNSEKVRELESDIESLSLAIHRCRTNLGHLAGWTKAMIQAEYSKLAVTLDPESDRYRMLEESFSFLCPRVLNSHSHLHRHHHHPAEGLVEDYDHGQRFAYVREMMPVIRRAGERSAPASLMALPYVQKFQCCGEHGDDPNSSLVVEALIEEMHQLAIAEGMRSRLEKQLDDPAKFRVLKREEEELERTEVRTSELVRRHYRKRSIRLHPDRNGEEMRPIFEEFTDARTVLSDVNLRQSYLRGMLDVHRYYGAAMMSESHDAWNRKHRPDKAEGRKNRDGISDEDKRGGGDRGTLKLEGGLDQQVPKKVVLHHRRDGRRNHVVSISVNVLRPAHEFYARVRSVRVELRGDASGADGGRPRVFELSRGQIVNGIRCDLQGGPVLANEIPVAETPLSPGHWEVSWRATLDTVGTDPLDPNGATGGEGVTTRSSAVSTFRVVDYDSLKKAQDFELAEYACKVIKGELANTLHKLRTNQSDSAASMGTPARFGHYHQVLVRARKRCSNLSRLMAITGRSSAVRDGLSALLGESRRAFAELEERANAVKKRREKRNDIKRFKAHVANVLESDDPASWMRGVDEPELLREGGDVNRLYQLFVEGKGKYVLMVDSEIYREASERKDLFSTRQCKDLAARGEEAKAQEAREEEEAVAAEARRKEEEEERDRIRNEAELRAKWAMVGHNATVHGLTSEKGIALNHQMARIVYYVVEKDRFEVQLYDCDEKAYLKKDNLNIYYGHVPKPKKLQQTPSPNRKNNANLERPSSAPEEGGGAWNCNQCTFENDDASVECSMCTEPRPKKKQDQQLVDTVVEKEELEVEKETATMPPAKEVHERSPKAAGSHNEQTKETIYVRSSHTKKLTGKRGRKKKELMNKSGTDNIQVETSAIGNQVPVHLIGSRLAVQKALMLIQEAVGIENVSGKINAPSPPPPEPAAPAPAIVSPPVVSVPALSVPSTAPAPVAPTLDPSAINMHQPSTSFANAGLYAGLEKLEDTRANGIPLVSHSESETQPASQYSFGDALLPRGLMDMTASSSTVPPELPSEIGINSQGMTRESITEASISSLNDRSNASKVVSHFTLNENDPLLAFLRAQHQCVKGSVDEFYTWLVKSEDIDSMEALKEAVSDEDYMNDTMKSGNGSCGVKGFKRKAFLRAVIEYEVEAKPADTIPPLTHEPSSNDSTSLHGMEGSAFLPSNLFANDDPSPSTVMMSDYSEPPQELVCPISLVLMTADPVLASDGVTYERASIENWFNTNVASIRTAQENLRWNPHSDRDRRVVESGIRSPAYGTMMKNLLLTPNTSVRNMARAYTERKDAALY